MERKTKSGRRDYYTETRIPVLDRMLGGGLTPGIVLLRGEPGVGKTTLALQVLANVIGASAAAKGGTPTGIGCYVSLELDPDEVLDHMSDAFGIPLDRVQDGESIGAGAIPCLTTVDHTKITDKLSERGDTPEGPTGDAKAEEDGDQNTSADSSRGLPGWFGQMLSICIGTARHRRLIGEAVQELRSIRDELLPVTDVLASYVQSLREVRNFLQPKNRDPEARTPMLSAAGRRLEAKHEALAEVWLRATQQEVEKPTWLENLINDVSQLHEQLDTCLDTEINPGKDYLVEQEIRLLDEELLKTKSGLLVQARPALEKFERLLDTARDVYGFLASKESIEVSDEERRKAEAAIRFFDDVGELCGQKRRGRHGKLRELNDLVEEFAERGEKVMEASRSMDNGDGTRIVVIDSLRLLVHLLAGRDQDTGGRLVMAFLHEIRRELLSHLPNTVIIVIGESHKRGSRSTSMLAESYLCDTEILLYKERVPSRGSQGGATQAREEERFFCRVEKARAGNRQNCRCSYDFSPQRGIEFYSTYPGDGRIQLFTENIHQEAEWQDFRDREVAETYPSLQFETFDRHALQRVFASRRRRFHVPQRNDMHLASVDSYWVSWYAQMSQRMMLAERLAAAGLPCHGHSSGSVDWFSLVVGDVHRLCMKSFERGPAAVLLYLARKGVLQDTGWLEEALPIAKAFEGDAGAEEGEEPPDMESMRQEQVQFPAEPGRMGIDFREVKRLCGHTKLSDAIAVIQELQKLQLEQHGPFRCSLSQYCQLVASRDDSSFPKTLRQDHLQKLPPCSQCSHEEASECAAKLERCLREEIWVGMPTESLLVELPESRLQLGGEHLSAMIPELREMGHLAGKPAYKPFNNPFDPNVLAVPYDANIGIMVLNRSRLSPTQNEAGLVAAMKEVYTLIWGTEPQAPVLGYFGEAAERLKSGGVPETWEEVLAMCATVEGRGRFLLETMVWDTTVVTYLEMLWSCGLDILVDEAYGLAIYDGTTVVGRFELDRGGKVLWHPAPGATGASEDDALDRLVRPLRILRVIFANDLCPVDHSFDSAAAIDAETATKRKNVPKRRDAGIGKEWLFARHWYSTFVDALARNWESDPKAAGGGEPGSGLEVFEIPVTADVRVACVPGEDDQATCKHHSCWGVWSLGVLRGSENTDLGIALINNLMATERISSRAQAAAAVPTVESHYKLYGDSPCFMVPGVPPKTVKPITWGELKDRFFATARSRHRIFDYRHVMDEFHALVEHVRHAASSGQDDQALAKSLRAKAKAAVERICQLNGRRIANSDGPITPKAHAGATGSAP